MERREFLRAGVAAGASALAASAPAAALDAAPRKPFKLKYAPHFGMFRAHAGDDLVDQLKFMHDQGFTALEDNGMKGRSREDQDKIGKELERLGMTMGVFVANSNAFGHSDFASGKRELRDQFVQEMKESVELAKRVNAKWCTVVPGLVHQRLEMDYQTANVIDSLKAMAEVAEPAGLTMVLEPLNPYRDHPGEFLTKIPQAYLICKAVGSPSCKILDDLYHQQITEGNLIPNIDKAWDEIAYFQIGDNPGRNEPTTGEINYQNVVKHIHGKGFEGILGMEHGNSQPGKEGELKLIAAYRHVDSFA